MLQKIKEQSNLEAKLGALKEMISEGWLTHIQQHPTLLQPNWPFRDQIAGEDWIFAKSSPNYHSYDSTEIYLHFFLSENAKWLFMCYFTCEAQKIVFFAVLTWFILLGKIQDGDHFLVRSRASSSTILDLFFRKIRAQIQDSWRGWIW